MCSFPEVASDIIQNKLTGLLSIVPKNSNSHLKIFFSNGEAYFMGFGDLKGAACLEACETLDLADCFFGRGARVNVDEKLSLPTSTIIDRLKKYMTRSKVSTPPPPRTVEDMQSQLRTALIRQIGPVGDMLFAKTLTDLHLSSSLTKQDLSLLADRLKDIIEDEKSKKEFLADANSILAAS